MSGIGILWRGDRSAGATAGNRLFDPLAAAFGALGVRAEPVIYSDDAVADVRSELLRLGAALVWVDPISAGQTRARLDELLREVSALGVWVSAHPDVILKLGTKQVLYTTRSLGWGTDTRLYTSPGQFRDEFPSALASGAPRVLKQNRGNGGLGVFRVELARPDDRPGRRSVVRVQHAQRGSVREELPLDDFMRRCERYFADAGRLVDQPLVPRRAEGMVRCYMVHGRVAGFGHQLVTALSDPAPGDSAPPPPPARTYHGPSKPEFRALEARLESEWIPQMQALLGIDSDSLPALWDADFLLGPKAPSGEDTYLLCEINASSVFPFPDEAREPLARAVAARCHATADARGPAPSSR